MAVKKTTGRPKPKTTNIKTKNKTKTVPQKKVEIKPESKPNNNELKTLQKDKNTWMLSTGILVILLIASIFTGGFNLNKTNYDATITDINILLDSATTTGAKTSLQNAKDEIETALALEATVKENEKKDSTISDSDKPVTLDMYVMSQCPYGVQAEEGAIPAVNNLIDSVDYNIYFIGQDLGKGQFSSLHGQPEVDENLRQVCIMEKYPEQFLDYLTCLNPSYRNAENTWKTCAEQNNIDTDEISTCQTGTEGATLLSESMKKSNEIGASGSPTIYINDQPYQKGRDTLSFTSAICQIARDDPACGDIPACASDADCTKTGFVGTCTNANTKDAVCEFTQPPVVNIQILNDNTCDGCDTTAFNDINKQIFINTEITTVDVSTAEGKALLEEINPTLIPVYIFDETVLKSSEYQRLEQFFTQVGDNYILSSDIVSQYVKGPKMIGRDKIENKLDLFVMSQCPYGVKAENNMKEVLNTFGDNIDFSIHFIANDNGDGTFNSLHGQSEVDENIRQLCVIENKKEKYFDYILCQNANYEAGQNLETTWETCATTNDIDTTVISACVTDKGADLLRTNIELTNELNIGSSPTFLVNNQVKFGGALPAEEIKTKFCAANPDTAGCDVTLSTETGIAPSGSC